MSQSKKDLLSRIRELEDENRRLRRDLTKHRRYSNRFADIIVESWDDAMNLDNFQEDKSKNKSSICEECGKGELQKVSILGIDFVVCQLCKARKKLK